jgi:predicted P-loop ATPase
MLDHALTLARRGFAVFPLQPREKGPLPRSNGCKDGTRDEAQINRFWRRTPDANIGIATGPISGVFVVDFDSAEARGELEAYLGAPLPPTLTATTGDGQHLHFRHPAGPAIRNRAGLRFAGRKHKIDIRGEGGYVVAPPSIHPSGAVYSWLAADVQPTEAPEALLELILAPDIAPAPIQAPPSGVVVERARKYLEQVDPAISGDYGHDALYRAACILVVDFDLDTETAYSLLASDYNPKCVPPWSEKEIRHKVADAAKKPGPRGKLLEGGDRAPHGGQGPAPIAPDTYQSKRSIGDWPVNLNDKGRPVICIHTAEVILSRDQDWLAPDGSPIVAWDEFRNCVVLRRAPPWRHHLPPGRPFEPDTKWSDVDDIRLSSWFSELYGLTFNNLSMLAAAVLRIAHENPIHPVREYLESLPKWDEVERLPNWLFNYLGAQSTPYTKDVGKWWMISAVARVMRPGSQSDHVLIPEGLQGAGKTSTFRILAVKPEWFLEFQGDIGGRDALEKLLGKWLVEMPELDGMGKAEVRKVKAFFTALCDTYRPAYGRRSVDFVRHCVFAGTTNDYEYLKDPSGNRRFWPVRCGAINLKGLEQDRDQLWAEAVWRFKQGEKYWPTTDEEKERCRAEQDRRFDSDLWEELVAGWIEVTELPDGVTLNRILEDALHIEISRRGQPEKNRLVKVLQRLGWEQGGQRRVEGEKCRLYYPGGEARARFDRVKAAAHKAEREKVSYETFDRYHR